MLKTLSYGLAITGSFFTIASTAQTATPPAGDNMIVEAIFDNNPADCQNDTVRLFIWTGAMPEEIGHAPVGVENGKAVVRFAVPAKDKGFFFIGKEPMSVKKFIAADELVVHLHGDCRNMANMVVDNSPINYQYSMLQLQLQQQTGAFSALIQRFREVANDPVQSKAVIAEMGKADKARLRMIDSLKNVNPMLARIVGMNTYLSYHNNRDSETQSEADYFGLNFLKYLDFDNEQNYRYQEFHEAIKNFSYNISRIGLVDRQQKEYLDLMLSKFVPNTFNHRGALFSVVLGSMNNSDGNFAYFGKKYLQMYENSNIAMSNFVKQQLARLGEAFVGNTAPEIKDASPEGKVISSKDFMGKVLVIDFWASWCGPCRRANPHLVELYNKYHSKGLEVLGVSLDKNKDSWIGAIQQDGLIWNHVSDLNQWNSKWAHLYGVTSIPHAVLVDKDGVILGKQLNPDQLTQELKRIFGE